MKSTKRATRRAVKLSKQDAVQIFASALNVLVESGVDYTLGNNERGDLAIVVHGVRINEEGTRLLVGDDGA
jgi:hypothetical protein